MELDHLAAQLQKISAASIAVAVVFNVISISLLTIRWILIQQRFLGAATQSRSANIANYWSSYIYNLITPANLGGDLYRYFSLKGDGSGSAQVIEQLLRERLVGLSSISVILSISLGYLLSIDEVNLPYGYPLFAGSIAFSCAISLIAVFPQIIFQGILSLIPLASGQSSVIMGIGKASDFFHFAGIFSLSLCSFMFCLLSIKVICDSMSILMPVENIMFIGALVEIIRFVPISVQGIGIREGGFATLFALIGSNAEAGYIVGLLVYAALTMAQIFLAIIGKMLLVKQHFGD